MTFKLHQLIVYESLFKSNVILAHLFVKVSRSGDRKMTFFSL